MTIAFLSLGYVILNAILEIPRHVFPLTSPFDSTHQIDYWLDIFLPIIKPPIYTFVFLLIFNSFGIWAAFRILKNSKSFIPVGSFGTLIFVMFSWFGIFWTHSAIIEEERALWNSDRFNLGFYKPEPWQMLIGIVFSILLIAIGIISIKRSFLDWDRKCNSCVESELI